MFARHDDALIQYIIMNNIGNVIAATFPVIKLVVCEVAEVKY